MMKRMKKRNRGQTALEYALVIGVIVVGVIVAGHKIFGKEGSVAENLMTQAVQEATSVITEPGAE